ncbi:MAG TPA: glycogen debranching N-terminal domain-containing protein, partial [bacterium]|nr:glycogen debranching N-terminal domain-containing protein [bacterium]
VFAFGSDGFIDGGEEGLFVHQTRMLSRYRWLIDGKIPTLVAASAVEPPSWFGYYITAAVGAGQGGADAGSGQIPNAAQQTLELRLAREVGGGVHELVTLTNYSQQAVTFHLELDVDADFLDQEEVIGGRQVEGSLSRQWRQQDGTGELAFAYTVEGSGDHHEGAVLPHLERGLTVRILAADTVPIHAHHRVGFSVALPPRGEWQARIALIPEVEGAALEHDHTQHARAIFLDEATAFIGPTSGTLTEVVTRALEQAKVDLAALRLYDLDDHARSWTMAAGLPVYVALFGRDTLTASWQAALASPDMMRGTLAELSKWQGRTVDDWRDEQPGRMLHEAHTGPLAMLNVTPRRRYYGSVTTSGFYPFVVSALWHWTGDKREVEPHLGPALRALRWCDEYGDLDGDGFYEYLTRSPRGVKHQGWKDSGDAIVAADGRQIDPPIATCEEQAFVYVAKLHLAEVLFWVGERDDARRLFRAAQELKKRFNDAFWMPDAGFFAMGLDARKRQIMSIGSNPGHCLAAGIIDAALVRQTAERLMAPDLFSGWGIRTLSSAHPAYNPYSYHRGSVWPVENATFALAFMRFGLRDHLHTLARAQFEAAALFDFHRLPELLSGHPRDAEHPFPALYPRTNWPQAWSSSAVFFLLQALLGLYPYAPLRLLFVDPHLPEWLPEITLRGLRVGGAVATIRFWRAADGRSRYQVHDLRGPLRVIRQPSPWSLTAGWGERAADAMTSLVSPQAALGVGALTLSGALLARRLLRRR